MKFKKIMLVAFVLLAILTIGAASAADDVASDDLAVEDIDEVSVDTSQDDLAEDSGDVLASSEEETVGDGEGYDITIHNGTYDQENDDETHVVDFTVPENFEGSIEVTADGISDEDIVEYGFDDLEDVDGIYYITPYDFSWDDGTYDITVKILDDDYNEVASQTGTLTFIGIDVDYDDDEINVNIWDVDDERGILYLDTEDRDIVSIDMPPESEGTIFIIVNGVERVKKVIEYDDTYWTSCQWDLQDLGIQESGNYTIEVKYNEETISEGNITVEEWEADSYRAEYIENEAAFVIYYVPGSNGTVFVKIENDDDGETVYDESFNFTSADENLTLYVAEFDIESDEAYHILITVSEDPDFIYSRGFYKEGDDDDDDGNEFEATLYDDEPMLFYWDSILEVYCPEESTGNVTVTVKDENGEIIYTSNKNVDDADEEGKLYWTLAELNITSVGEYTLEVSNDGEEIDDLEMETVSPIWIEDNTFINSTDKGLLVSVFLPISIENATIIVSIEDKSFSFSLNDFVYVEDDNDGSKPIWFNPGFGPEPDMNQKSYRISNSNLEFDFEEKTYEVYVKLMIEGMDEISDSNDVEFISRNVIGNDNVTIEIFNGEYAFDFGDDVVKIAKEDDCEGYILITVADNAWNKTIDLSEIIEAVYLCVDDFADLGKGEFEITVAYYDENDEMVFNVTGTVSFYYSDDDADDGVVFHVLNGDEKEFDLNNQDDLNIPFAYVSVKNDIDGRIVIIIWDEEGDEQELCSFDLDNITNTNTDYLEGFTVYMIALNDLKDYNDLIECGRFKLAFVDDMDDEVDSRSYDIDLDGNSLMFWEVKDDAEDGVVISVPDGDDKEFDLNNQDDLDYPFAYVSVRNDIDGRIVIIIWAGEEGDEQELYSFDLDNITNTEDDDDHEGFKVYMIALNDLGNYDDFIECGSFKLAFINDDEEQIDSRNYDIEEDDGIVAFWESDDEEEIHGEGEYLEDVIFVNGNVITNDIIIYIPSNVSEIVDDEFEVWNDGDTYNFKLSELDTADGFYVIKVRDLFDIDDVGEGRGLDIFIQFYDDGEKAYYASPEDDEYGIEVYTSPFVNDEAYILENGFVVSFRGFEDVDDEFTVTISQEGAADIVKTFKISEIEAFVDDYAFYELHLSDLNITEPGNYTIAVNFTRDGENLAYNVGDVDVGMVLVRAHGPDEDEDPVVSDVSAIVFHIGASEDVSGFARLFVDGVQVGEDISFADLEFNDRPSHYGRQIYLNNYHITENGTYTFKVEVYDENGRFLADCENELQIAVGENSFEFISGPYGNEGGIEVVIRTPLEDGQYYNFYFNGELAGNYTAGSGFVISDMYLDQYFEMTIFKPGVYDVNVTFFDGENETDVTTGSFSVNELALTSDKTVYIIYEDHIMISFNADLLDDDSLRAYYVYGWDRVQRDDEMIFNPYGGEDMKNDGMYNDGIVSFDIAWTPDGHYAMEEGTTLIYVKYKHGEEEFGGFINVTVVEAPVPVDPELAIDPVDDVEEGTNVVITITALDNFTGSVKVLVGGVEVGVAEVTAGSGTFTIGAGNFTVGENTVKVVS
ncbi:hypothetical protein, partial [Methanobrevibacter sp.]|uniref:hypothetical protein n=1 Tax=Methanobrevibacter sp. TaxID=66852 RepID=UPI00386322B0